MRQVFRILNVSLAALVALVASGVARPANAEVISESTPFVSPKGAYVTQQGQYHTFRIPGMIVAPDGAVLTFAEGRRGDGSDPRTDDNAPMDMTMRRSTDNGKTWEPLVVIESGFQPNGDKVDFAAPTPVLDETTGVIHLLYGQWPDLGSITPDQGQSIDPADNNHVAWVRSSDDNGLTWSDRRLIIYPDQPGETSDGLFWRQAEPGPGNGIQLKWQDDNPARNGRLVVPAKRTAASNASGSGTFTTEPFVYYSDDHGTTWQIGDTTAGPDANEDEVVELTNGDLLLDGRQNSGNFRRRHLSSDGGQTWGADDPDDIAITAVDAGMFRSSAVRAGHDRDRILFSGPLGPGRENIAVWTSYDEGKTFINPVQFNEAFAAYSVVQRLGDGTIGLLVETENEAGQTYGGITFINFDLAELEKADHPATTSHYDGFGNQVDAFRGGVGWSGGWNSVGVTVEAGGLEFNGFPTEGDDRHAHLRGDEMTRSLGGGALNLNQNQDYYLSLFVEHDNRDGQNESSEFLDVLLQDETGTTQAAFGVGSSENFFVSSLGATVSSANDALTRDNTYLLLVKLAAQDDAAGGNFDQLFLARYDDPSQVPTDESQIHWQLVGDTTENVGSSIERITIRGGDNADWLVDGLRIGTTFDAVIVDTGVILPVRGDITGDGLVNQADIDAFLANWRTSGWVGEAEQIAHGDLNTDGLVSLPDAFILHAALERHGMSVSLQALFGIRVAEPSTMTLLGVAAITRLLLRHKRSRCTTRETK